MIDRNTGAAFLEVEKGNLTRVVLLMKTIDSNVRNEARQSLLHVAAGRNGSASIASYLIGAGVNPDHQDEDGATAAHYAAVWNQADVLTVIIRGGGSIEIVDKHGNQPLWHAVHRGSLEAIRILMAHGADMNRRNNYGRSALELARSKADAEPLKVLLDPTDVER
jgi:ankyrin repeat protein